MCVPHPNLCVVLAYVCTCATCVCSFGGQRLISALSIVTHIVIVVVVLTIFFEFLKIFFLCICVF